MTFFMFGKEPKGPRKLRKQKQPTPLAQSPSYQQGNGYQATQTTLAPYRAPQQPVMHLANPPPMNPGWTAFPGQYPQSLPTITVSQPPAYVQPVPVRPITAGAPHSTPWGSTATLAPPLPQQQPHQSRWSPQSMGKALKRPVVATAASANTLGNNMQQKASFYKHSTSASFSNLNESLNHKASGYKLAAATSVTNLNEGVQQRTAGYMNQAAALSDRIASRLDAVITAMDGERFSGNEEDLIITHDTSAGFTHERSRSNNERHLKVGAPDANLTLTSTNFFSKVWLYSNSRLPPHLPPFKAYINTYQLLCLAAQYSENVYNNPVGAERETHVDANWRTGTKAMVIKSAPMDELHTIVFAIRGSATFMDWAVNFRPEPTSPGKFLDDPGNLCHSGFLDCAQKMVKPVASRLKQLIETNPGRQTYSLCITGHSAGGAVAQLLYAHMMSTKVSSDLTKLTPFFKRVHCVTFGAPPVSLLPLKKPDDHAHRKHLFYSFINEGDPVTRAEPAVMRSLLKLYTTPAPVPVTAPAKKLASVTNLVSATTTAAIKPKKKHKEKAPAPLPTWPIPQTAMSCGGRLVLLREKPGFSGPQRPVGESGEIEAVTITDQQLRGVVFGDPVCHTMSLYTRRIESLATKAVTVREMG